MSFTVTPRRALVVSLSLVIAIVLVGVSPAAAAEPTVVVKAGAAVQAQGAALVVDVVVTCPAGTDMFLSGRVTQRRPDKTLARGTSGQPVKCSGAPQTRRLAVGALDPSGDGGPAKPFVVGPAFVTAVLGVCTEEACSEVRSHRTVQASAVTVDTPHFSSSAITVTLPATAKLEAAGAGVTVSIQYRCTSGRSGGVSASLLQRTSRSAVTGAFDGVNVTCTGLGRTGVLAFHMEAAAWRAGPAFVVIGGDVCGAGKCRTIHAYRTLTVA